jgi:protein O-GlcNAc transferase
MMLEQLTQLYRDAAELRATGQLDQAVERLDVVARLIAAEAGKIRAEQSYWDAALPLLERAAVDLDDLEIQLLLARAYRLHLRFDDAVAPLSRGLGGFAVEQRANVVTRPDVMETLCAVCTELQHGLLRPGDAITLYRLALESVSDNESLLYGMGLALFQMGRTSDSLSVFEQLLLIDKQHVHALFASALCHDTTGDQRPLLAFLMRVLELEPAHAGALRLALERMCLSCDWDRLPEIRSQIARVLDESWHIPAVTLLMMQANYDDAAQQLRWTRKLLASKYVDEGCEPFKSSLVGQTRKRLRIGYFSPHFGDTPIGNLVADMFAFHDTTAFEVFIYSYGPNDGHCNRKRIIKTVEHFLDYGNTTPKQLAEGIRKDEIDILVDLSGPLGMHTPKTLAHRPAPLQINWLGYIGTLGTTTYDYIIADGFVAPEGFDEFFEEKVLRLPHTFQVTSLPVIVGESKRFSREYYGIPENAFVFLNCGMNYKIQPEVFRIWVRVVSQVPGSVLWLLRGEYDSDVNLRREWAKYGLAQERLIISSRVPTDEHLARISLADLFIDTYPCGSGATANDVLRAGLPLLSLSGETMVSRMAGSLLHAIGLPELATSSLPEYEKKAIYYATHPHELLRLRERLAANKLTWPLFDTPRFVRNLESGFRQMAERARAGLPPAAITVMEEQI